MAFKPSWREEAGICGSAVQAGGTAGQGLQAGARRSSGRSVRGSWSRVSGGPAGHGVREAVAGDQVRPWPYWGSPEAASVVEFSVWVKTCRKEGKE